MLRLSVCMKNWKFNSFHSSIGLERHTDRAGLVGRRSSLYGKARRQTDRDRQTDRQTEKGSALTIESLDLRIWFSW